MTFSEALEKMKAGSLTTRKNWGEIWITVGVQFPDKNSKMTKPYLYMCKRSWTFPLELSCESIFADDWVDVD